MDTLVEQLQHELAAVLLSGVDRGEDDVDTGLLLGRE